MYITLFQNQIKINMLCFFTLSVNYIYNVLHNIHHCSCTWTLWSGRCTLRSHTDCCDTHPLQLQQMYEYLKQYKQNTIESLFNLHSQCVPVKPSLQLHMNPWIWSMHSPFTHGLLWHSSTSTTTVIFKTIFKQICNTNFMI